MFNNKMMNNLNEIMKLKLGNVDENYKINISVQQLRKMKTLVRESELIRIVKAVSPDNCNLGSSGKYPYIKDLLSVKVKTNLYENIVEQTEGILTVEYFDNTLIKYQRLVSSSGGIKNKKVVFVNCEIYDKVKEILLCGVDVNKNPLLSKPMERSKYNAYMGLCTTDSIPVTFPSGMVVVDDYIHNVQDTFDVVNDYGNDEYKVVTDQKMTVGIKSFDGAGIIDIGLAREWAFTNLGLNYVPSSFQIRCAGGIKGCLFVVDIKKFLKDREGILKDCFNGSKEYDFKQDKIQIILTKSMFKFINFYESYDEWKKIFDEEKHGYKRTMNVSMVSVDWKKLQEKRTMAYQTIQSLDLKDDEIKSLCQYTVDEIKNISTDIDSFIKYRGLDTEEWSDLPPYYKALVHDKELFYDKYVQEKMKDDIQGLKNRAYMGKVIIDGCYQILCPDLQGLLEHAFGMEVKGLIERDMVYSKYWMQKDIERIDVARYPHIFHEWAVKKVITHSVDDKDKPYDVFTHVPECLIVSMDDAITLRLGTADHDGDAVTSISNDVIHNATSRVKYNTILHQVSQKEKTEEQLAIESKMTLKQKEIIDEKQKQNALKEFNEKYDLCEQNLIETDIAGMNNDIGSIVNKISVLWSLYLTTIDNAEKIIIENYLKVMNIVSCKTIDFAKSGIKAKIPSEIIQYLEDKKLPYFFKYVYPKKLTEEKRINNNNSILNKESISLFQEPKGTMDRLCYYMEGQIKDISISYGDESVFDWKKLLSNQRFSATCDAEKDEYYKILDALKVLKNESDSLASKSHDDEYDREHHDENDARYKILYDYCRVVLLAIENNPSRLANFMVYAFYDQNEFSNSNPDKSILWNVVYGELIKRIKNKKGKELKETKLVDHKIIKERHDKKKQKLDKLKLKKSNSINIIIKGSPLFQVGDIKKTFNDKFRSEESDMLIGYLKTKFDSTKNILSLSKMNSIILADANIYNHAHMLPSDDEFVQLHGKENKTLLDIQKENRVILQFLYPNDIKKCRLLDDIIINNQTIKQQIIDNKKLNNINIINPEIKDLFNVLFALYSMFERQSVDFEIHQDSKNRITTNHIMKMAGLCSTSKYKEYMKVLNEKGYIALSQKNSSSKVLICMVKNAQEMVA